MFVKRFWLKTVAFWLIYVFIRVANLNPEPLLFDSFIDESSIELLKSRILIDSQSTIQWIAVSISPTAHVLNKTRRCLFSLFLSRVQLSLLLEWPLNDRRIEPLGLQAVTCQLPERHGGQGNDVNRHISGVICLPARLSRFHLGISLSLSSLVSQVKLSD